MELSLANLDQANRNFNGLGALFYPCKPEMQTTENKLDLRTGGPVLMVINGDYRDVGCFAYQWFSRVAPGLSNDYETFDTYLELLQAIRQESKQYPELNIQENQGWFAGDASWW